MMDTDVWFTLNVGRITSEGNKYTFEPSYSRTARLTSPGGIDDLLPARDELHRLLDGAIDYICKAQELEAFAGLKMLCPKCKGETPAKKTFFHFSGISWPIYVCEICGFELDPFVTDADRQPKNKDS